MSNPHGESHFACDEQLAKYGGKTVGCCCTGHLCKKPTSSLRERIWKAMEDTKLRHISKESVVAIEQLVADEQKALLERLPKHLIDNGYAAPRGILEWIEIESAKLGKEQG